MTNIANSINVSGSSVKLQRRNTTKKIGTFKVRQSNGKISYVKGNRLSLRGQAVQSRLLNERNSILQKQDEIEERFNTLLKLLKD
ncbi:hypothetical protein J7E55_25860 [Bacillus sp. ISL-53]|nr:hypothetical protein [Bacillus sp. ISL-53]